VLSVGGGDIDGRCGSFRQMDVRMIAYVRLWDWQKELGGLFRSVLVRKAT